MSPLNNNVLCASETAQIMYSFDMWIIKLGFFYYTIIWHFLSQVRLLLCLHLLTPLISIALSSAQSFFLALIFSLFIDRPNIDVFGKPTAPMHIFLFIIMRAMLRHNNHNNNNNNNSKKATTTFGYKAPRAIKCTTMHNSTVKYIA